MRVRLAACMTPLIRLTYTGMLSLLALVIQKELHFSFGAAHIVSVQVMHANSFRYKSSDTHATEEMVVSSASQDTCVKAVVRVVWHSNTCSRRQVIHD